MKSIRKLVDLVKANILFLVLIVLMIGIGAWMPSSYWSFVDDGEIIEVSQRMDASLNLLTRGHVLEWLKDPQVGRFRPVYWLFHYLVYVLFGIDHSGHGFMQILLMWGTGIFIYLTAKKISGSNVAGFLAGLLFVANTLNQENWYRLGPQEAPMVFFVSAAVFSLVLFISERLSFTDVWIKFRKVDRRTLKLAIQSLIPETDWLKDLFYFGPKRMAFYFNVTLLATFLAYFTKENSIAFLIFPTLLYVWISQLRGNDADFLKPKMFFYLIYSFVLASIARFGAIYNYKTDSYASDFLITLPNIQSNLVYYVSLIWITFQPLIIVVSVYIIVKIFQFITEKRVGTHSSISIFILATFLCFFAIQLPWQYAIPRYLLPAMYFFTLFMGLMLERVLTVLKDAKNNDFLKMVGLSSFGRLMHMGLWLLIMVVTIYNLLLMGQYISRIYRLTTDFNRPLIAYLAENTGQGGTIVLDTPPGTAIELKQEIGLHLRLFFNRGDVVVRYLEDVPKPGTGDILLRAGEFRQVSTADSFPAGVLGTVKQINITIENKLYYPPARFIGEYLPPYVVSYLRGGMPRPKFIVASSVDNYYWEVYKLNPVK